MKNVVLATSKFAIAPLRMSWWQVYHLNKPFDFHLFHYFVFQFQTGRTGPGDSVLLHSILFDHSGPIAYHSAVHDAFGYLKNYHNTGPGYNYLSTCSMFATENPAAGQISGINFWNKVFMKNIWYDIWTFFYS